MTTTRGVGRCGGPDGTRSTLSTTDDEDRVGQLFEALGDLDDGTERILWLRPEGTANWCKTTGKLG